METNILLEQEIDTQPFDREVQILKALANPARLAVLEVLRDGEHCVCHMEAYLGFRQAYISQQLMVLREVGLIQDRRDGWNIYYRITDERIFDVLNAVRKVTGQCDPELQKPKMPCTCPKCSIQGGMGLK
jgi:DNA-binding transcriptional ArsR family regulator